MKKELGGNKSGQMQIGFGMIFSIIIIIAIVGVAFYVITFFLDLGDCSQNGFFYDDLEGEIEKAWKSTSYSNLIALEPGKGIDKICFGHIDSEAKNIESEEIQEEIDFSIYRSETSNIYLYPARKACDGDLASKKLEHVSIEGFWCLDSGKEVRLEKDSTETLVNVCEEGENCI